MKNERDVNMLSRDAIVHLVENNVVANTNIQDNTMLFFAN